MVVFQLVGHLVCILRAWLADAFKVFWNLERCKVFGCYFTVGLSACFGLVVCILLIKTKIFFWVQLVLFNILKYLERYILFARESIQIMNELLATKNLQPLLLTTILLFLVNSLLKQVLNKLVFRLLMQRQTPILLQHSLCLQLQSIARKVQALRC